MFTQRNSAFYLLVFSILLAIAVAVAGVWIWLAPSPSDSYNLFYVLWKHHLWRLSAENICAGMAADPHRERLIIGKTRAELQRMFELQEITDASDYAQQWYQTSDYKGREVAVLKNCRWMVVFTNDRVSELLLLKG